MKFVIIFFIISVYLIVENAALMCYYCKSHPHSNCDAKKVPPNFVSQNCESVPENEKAAGAKNYCYKVEKEIQIEQAFSNFTYNRGCTIGGGKTDFCWRQYIMDPEVKCYLCDTDRCNAGSALKFTKFLLIGAAILIVLSILSV